MALEPSRCARCDYQLSGRDDPHDCRDDVDDVWVWERWRDADSDREYVICYFRGEDPVELFIQGNKSRREDTLLRRWEGREEDEPTAEWLQKQVDQLEQVLDADEPEHSPLWTSLEAFVRDANPRALEALTGQDEPFQETQWYRTELHWSERERAQMMQGLIPPIEPVTIEQWLALLRRGRWSTFLTQLECLQPRKPDFENRYSYAETFTNPREALSAVMDRIIGERMEFPDGLDAFVFEESGPARYPMGRRTDG